MHAEEKSEEESDMQRRPKPLRWIASSRKDLRRFPEEVKDVMGFALYQAQMGGKHASAKALKGFSSAGVLEIIDDYDGDTYRGVYTVNFKGSVYVLDVFQKKSKKGSKTPQGDIDRIKKRLKMAENDFAERRQANQGEQNNVQSEEAKKDRKRAEK
jgi:phage-related protein